MSFKQSSLTFCLKISKFSKIFPTNSWNYSFWQKIYFFNFKISKTKILKISYSSFVFSISFIIKTKNFSKFPSLRSHRRIKRQLKKSFELNKIRERAQLLALMVFTLLENKKNYIQANWISTRFGRKQSKKSIQSNMYSDSIFK